MADYPEGISLELFLELAREAGRIQLAHLTSDALDIVIKPDNTPVTLVDRSINDLIIREIRKRNQEVSIIGEEESSPTESDYLILLDPLDGTQPFLRREPVFTFCMALLHEGDPILAVTINPSLDKLYHAERGKGTWLNGTTRLHVNTVTQGGGTPHPFVRMATWGGDPYRLFEVADRLKEIGFDVFDANSIANSMAEVAEGTSCGTLFPAAHTHDTAPGILLIDEAGGRCTSLHGHPQRYDHTMDGHLTSNGPLHETFLQIIREVEAEHRAIAERLFRAQ